MTDGSEMERMVQTVRENVTDLSLDLEPRKDFPFLSKFIRAKKLNTDNATTAVAKYYKGIFSNLEKFEGLRVSDIACVYEEGVIRQLRSRIQNVAVVATFISDWDVDVHSAEELCLAFSFLMEELLLDETFQENGIALLVDMSGFGLSHALQATYGMVKFAMTLVFGIYPTRVSAFHFLHPPSLFWPIFKIMEKFIPSKLRDRVKFHSDVSSLHDCIAPSVLPESLGGDLDENEAWDKTLVMNLIKKDVRHEKYWKETK